MHPIVRVLEDQGRRQTWLARRIGVNAEHLNRVIRGNRPASAHFRQACALALGVPQDLLFHAIPPGDASVDAPEGTRAVAV